MKNSIIVILFFILGIIAAHTQLPLEFLKVENVSLYVLYLLLFSVGMGVGSNKKSWKLIKNANIKIILIPVSVITGTILFTFIASFIIKGLSIKECLAVASGFGYYSLSSTIITRLHGEGLGLIALLSNISREIITLAFTPVMVKYLGKIAPISSGGATSMDTTLPVITKFSGEEYAIISVFNGVVLTILVPFLIILFIG